MAKVTITLPDTDEPIDRQIVRLLGDLPVLPSGALGSREITLTGTRHHLALAIYLSCGDDYLRAHQICQGITGPALP
jgi:hypothetical protein